MFKTWLYYSYYSPGAIMIFMFMIAQVFCNLQVYSCPKSPLTIHPCKCFNTTNFGIKAECINANLASISLALANIADKQISVDTLLIDTSNFGALFGTIFLNLKVNKISIQNIPIKNIDEYVFYGANETLMDLDFTNTSLKVFPKSFKILGKLMYLKLNRHHITTLDPSAFDGPIKEKLERLHLSNGNLSEISIEFLQPLRKLKTIDLHGNQLDSLKRNQFKNLRDLESLDISYNNIAKIDSSHIAELTKLSFCNISHNSITEIARGTFARNSVLRLLDISGNKIKRLDANSFRGMRFLRRLYLNDNLISDVGRGTFSSITRIGTIDLARNQLKKVDYQMFASLNYIEIINLAENKIVEIQKQSFKDLYLTHINISHNFIERFEPQSFENCVNMSILDLSHNSITTFTKKTFDELSYATEIILSFNRLTNLSAVPLGNMTGIKVLNVSYNQILEIPKNTFPKLYELHTIDISHNNLTQIFNGVFQTLFSFRYLNLSFNRLEEIKSATFGTIPTLLEINLNDNKLRNVAKSSFTKLESLRSLTIENNQLTHIFDIPNALNYLSLCNNSIYSIPSRTWPSMNALIVLDLRHNLLENRLNEDSFRGLLSLRHIYLSNNGITMIPSTSFPILSSLQYLHLENNKIRDIPLRAFGKLPVVFEINLSKNLISNISSKAFDGLLHLLTLNLSRNNISVIPIDAFYGLVSLRNLDISFNSLEKLDNKTNGVLDGCLSLENINLSNNKFSFITKKTFPSDPYIPYPLKEIDLSYNEIPVLTYDLAFGTQNVKFLNISHNYINEIRSNILSNLTQIEILDISYNELTTLSNDDFNFTLSEKLTNLYASKNKFRYFEIGNLQYPATLNFLDLQNNLIELFDLKLLTQVKRGLQLHISGNPLRCDCNIRPLKQFYQTVLNKPKSYSDIICRAPDVLSNKHLEEIDDESLNCINKTINNDLYAIPDLKFREIFFFRGNLSISWSVLQMSKDIAGFHISIRNPSNQIIVEHHLPYDRRMDFIPGNEICQMKCEHLELCILAKDSQGSINSWFDTQCTLLPNNFEYILEKYSVDSDKVYVIQTTRKNVKTQDIDEHYGTKSSSSSSNSILKLCKVLQFILVIWFYKVVLCQ
ncbi:protein artichoke [Contarinia nasturtii]|uniref:protein artichoke n=1 Tax=Contarinia nasturtii TaxID=265458 RepID=UPI0012D3BFB2|nr:protein artichoke [Contarinia nasturtii]XP_031640253.1 protein artichoke [Contarinia nasturtii]XP_031640262.1 protein artichoke [Contarinia nasturtii]